MFSSISKHLVRATAKSTKSGVLAPLAPSFSSSSAAVVDFWSGVEEAPRDPILGVTEKFLADTNPDKMNLGVVSEPFQTESEKDMCYQLPFPVSHSLKRFCFCFCFFRT